MKSIFSEQESAALRKLNAETEKRTNTQVVLSIVQKSDNYPEIPWKAFASGTSLAGVLLIILQFTLSSIFSQTGALLIVTFILSMGALFALLTVFIPAFAKFFLCQTRAESEVYQYAESLFLKYELFATKNRNGVLLLVSLFERKVIVLPDKEMANLIDKKAMHDVIAVMKPFLKKGKPFDAFKAGMEKLSSILKAAPGIKAGGENELPDEIIEEEGA